MTSGVSTRYFMRAPSAASMFTTQSSHIGNRILPALPIEPPSGDPVFAYTVHLHIRGDIWNGEWWHGPWLRRFKIASTLRTIQRFALGASPRAGPIALLGGRHGLLEVRKPALRVSTPREPPEMAPRVLPAVLT